METGEASRRRVKVKQGWRWPNTAGRERRQVRKRRKRAGRCSGSHGMTIAARMVNM